jgi:TatA/E family protein of Tat protein translocase
MERLWWLIPIVLVIVLLFGGAQKLPEFGAGMGRAIREFRNAMAGTPDAAAPATAPPAAGTPGGYDAAAQWAPVPEVRPQAIVPDEAPRG